MSALLPWQAEVWQTLNAREERLPHALLLRGRSGIGKTQFARAFAQALLCEERSGSDAQACGHCAACNWFAQGNHPDFRQVEPEALSGAVEEGERKPSKQIRIEQVRELQDFLAIGSHRGGLRVVIVRPAEAMNTATANALLKSLEEPPPQTLFLLVASNPARLLPTIRSRCQAVDLPLPDKDSAAQWLTTQGMKNASAALAHAGYAPLAAQEDEAGAEIRARLLDRLSRRVSDPLALADACSGGELPQVVDWLQKWAYDLAAVRMNQAPRYHPAAAKALAAVGERMDARELLAYQRRLAQARAVSQHPLNPRLFLEDLFMQYGALVRN